MPGWKKDGLSGKSADYILCPFFHAHGDRTILCEGNIPDTRSEVKFKNKVEKNQHQTIFCEGCYNKCEHYLSVIHFQWKEEE